MSRRFTIQHEAHLDPAIEALLQHERAPITARPIWWSAWARAFGQEPWLLALPDNGGAAPLAIQEGRTQTRIQMLGGSDADHSRLFADSGRHARELGDLLINELSDLGRSWHLQLEHLPAGDPVAQRLAEALPGCVWKLAPDRASPYVRLRPDTSVEDYLGRASRKTRRRTIRDFVQAEGTVRHTQDPSEVAGVLPKLAAVRRARDHRCDRVSDLDSPMGYAFWASVISDHAAAGEVEIALAEIRGRLVGYDVILLDGPAERLWDGRVSPEGEALSVGRLLQDVALERALDRGAEELDLLRGVTAAKLRLATDVRVCSVLEAWSSRYQQRLTVTSRGGIGWARQVRDSHDGLDQLWRAAKQRTLLRDAPLDTRSDR